MSSLTVKALKMLCQMTLWKSWSEQQKVILIPANYIVKVTKCMTEAPVLAFPNRCQVFKVSCNISSNGINVILSQEWHSISFLSENLNNGKLKYSSHDKKFYVIVSTLQIWSHYLFPKEFIIDYNKLRSISIFNRGSTTEIQKGEDS